MDKINRLTFINGFRLNGEELTTAQVVDKYNEIKAQNDKLKKGAVAFYQNEINKIEEI